MKLAEPETDCSILIPHYEYHKIKWLREVSVDFFFWLIYSTDMWFNLRKILVPLWATIRYKPYKTSDLDLKGLFHPK